jgi:membrane-bound lytic murein transglycosylase D
MFALNPAFNRMTTPPDGPYRLLLPVQSVEPFRLAMQTDAGAAQLAAAAVAPPQTTHQVRRGDTISAIARRYDISTGQLLEANGLAGATIHPGDVLQVPGAGSALASAAPREEIAAQLPERQKASRQQSPGVHLVKPGDTLWGVARRYGVTVPALAAENGIDSKSQLAAGDRLKIPGGSRSASSGPAEATRTTYQVRRGDTLTEIADKFNVSVRQLTTWNGLRQSGTLRTGQRLVVYSDPKRVDGG